jgi:hypothetical protein
MDTVDLAIASKEEGSRPRIQVFRLRDLGLQFLGFARHRVRILDAVFLNKRPETGLVRELLGYSKSSATISSPSA